jgi:hypothetical protein
MAALLVEKIRKCRRRVFVAALLVGNNPQMPPSCTSGCTPVVGEVLLLLLQRFCSIHKSKTALQS